MTNQLPVSKAQATRRCPVVSKSYVTVDTSGIMSLWICSNSKAVSQSVDTSGQCPCECESTPKLSITFWTTVCKTMRLSDRCMFVRSGTLEEYSGQTVARHLTIILLYLHFLWLLSFWYRWVQNLMLYLHTNYEKLLVSLSEEKREFHLALSPEISLLRDFVAPILL